MRDALQGLTTRGRSLRRRRARRPGRPSGARPARTCCGSAVLLLALPLVSARGRGRGRATGCRPAAGCGSAAHRRRPGDARSPCGWTTSPGCRPGCCSSRTRCPTCSGPGPGSCSTGSSRAAAARSPTPCAPTCAAGSAVGPLPIRLTDPFGMCELHPLVHQPRHPGGHPAGAGRCRRCRSPASGPAAARAGAGRWPAPARTTPAPASTATATTCAGCTGAPPPGSAS